MWAMQDGVLLPLEQCKVSVMDRGYLFGDGVYEVARLYDGRPFLLRAHMDRLERSLESMRIQGFNRTSTEHRLARLLDHTKLDHAMFYLQITRGAGAQRSHAFPNPSTDPSELIYITPLPEHPRDFYERGCAAVTHEDIRWGRCNIKSINLLGNVMAATYAKERGAYEAILVNKAGRVMEGSHTSVFWVRDGILGTTPLTENILPGVTRERVLAIAAQQGIRVDYSPMPLSSLLECDEVFITATTIEILPVRTVDGKEIGQPGPMTGRLLRAYRTEVERFLATPKS
jgi:D-alanine transaminase